MICGFQFLPSCDLGSDLKVATISSGYDEGYLNLSEIVGSPRERFILDSGLSGNLLRSTEFRSCSMNPLISLLKSRKDKFPLTILDHLLGTT
jgi:hypothetical protein